MWIIGDDYAINTDHISWLGQDDNKAGAVVGVYADGKETVIAPYWSFEKIAQALKNNDNFVEV